MLNGGPFGSLSQAMPCASTRKRLPAPEGAGRREGATPGSPVARERGQNLWRRPATTARWSSPGFGVMLLPMA